VVRQIEAPKVEVYLVPLGGKKWGGHRRMRHCDDRPAVASDFRDRKAVELR